MAEGRFDHPPKQGVLDVTWAMKILEYDEGYQKNLISQYFHSIYLGVIGGLSPMLVNWVYRRPLYTGIHRPLIGISIGIGLGRFFRLREDRVTAERDAMLRDYISRHPEDFPPPDKKTFGEIFDEWTPIR